MNVLNRFTPTLILVKFPTTFKVFIVDPQHCGFQQSK